MKVKRVYLFLSVACLLSIIFGKNIFRLVSDGNQGKLNMRIAYPVAHPASHYDPAKIYRIFEYSFLENIYTPLTEYAPNGDLVAGLAERFEWHGNEAQFLIRKDYYTIDNHRIDAYDVEISFKRLFLLGGNTHGDLKDLLCKNTNFKTINDFCPGMEVRNNGELFVLKFNKKQTFLFPMLAAIDFVVIPKGSIDPQTLTIIDYRNTSGPYFVEKDSPDGSLVLSANPKHYHYNMNIPQKVFFHPYDGKKLGASLQLLESGKVDHVPPFDKTPCDAVLDFAAKHREIYNLYQTHPISLLSIGFTKKGLNTLSEEERWNIGKTTKKILMQKYENKAGWTNTDQMLPFEGKIAQKDIKEIEKKFNRVKVGAIINKSILVWDNMNILEKDLAVLQLSMPKAKVLNITSIPAFTDFKKEYLEEPDLRIYSTDTGFQEDIGLTTYHLNTGTLRPYNETKEAWLKAYTNEPEKTRRFEMLRKLQYDSLSHVVTMPVAMCPFVSLVKKPWKYHMSQQMISDQLWRIRKD